MSQANITRAELAFDAVLTGTHDFKNEPREELGTYVGDLLANLMHLCDRDGIDFEDCLRRGRMHYSEEKGHYDSGPYVCDSCGRRTAQTPKLGDVCKVCGSGEFTLADAVQASPSEI